MNKILMKKVNATEGSEEIADLDLALLCDIDLDFFLVPKVWIKEIVRQKFFNCIIELLRLAELNNMNHFDIESAINSYAQMLSQQQKTFYAELKEQCDKIQKQTNKVNSNFKNSIILLT